MLPKIRTLVIDDEPLAREGIISMLAQDEEIEVVGVGSDGESALQAVRLHRPQLIFLDVQMPKRDGFEMLGQLRREERPQVIFVTAYNQYAFQAFEVCAIDYLLKPFSDARFLAALSRAKERIRRDQARAMDEKIDQLLKYMEALVRHDSPVSPLAAAAVANSLDRVPIKTGSDIHFIKAADIIWVESQADFVRVHTVGAAQLVRETLHSFEERVDPAKFLRIHRSSLVNLDHVRKVTPALYGDYVVLLSNDTKLRLSRGNRSKLKQLIARLSTGRDSVSSPTPS
jgi:two-component system LytT family response regulator